MSGGLGDLVDRAAATLLHVPLTHVSPLAVPVLIMIGRENVAQHETENAILAQAEEALAALAMTPD